MSDHDYDWRPVLLRFQEQAAFTETYGYAGSQGMVLLEGMHILPRGRPSDTCILMMHPSSTLHTLPIPNALAAQGLHVLCCGSRYPKNDTALIMEKVLIDLGAYVRHAREALGYEKVVLLGWSGGGSLSLFYQAQAEHPEVTSTPAGDPLDLTGAGLQPADAVLFIAAHASRARVLTEWLDPSVLDELNPDLRETELDIYDPYNPNQPPYGAAFLVRYRQRQIARNRAITAWVHEQLDTLSRAATGELERGFVVHRTMADPRWLDPAVDPNERRPGWCYLGDPQVVNTGPVGLARFCTLRSWLSQWSYDESRADGVASARRISVPLLTIVNSADDACPPSHTAEIFAAAGSADKQEQVIEGANHYYKGQPEHLRSACARIERWLAERGLGA